MSFYANPRRKPLLMKNIFCFLLITLMSLSLAACNSEGQEKQNLPGGSVKRENGKPVQQQEQAPVTAPQALPGGSVKR